MKRLLLLLITYSLSLTTIDSQIINTVAGNGTAGYFGDGAQATAAELYNPIWVAFDTANNMYISDNHTNVISKVNASGVITTFAGNGTAGFYGDGGQATAAELNGPIGITCDKHSNLYIVDFSNYRIRMVDKNGIITTIAGNGTNTYYGDGGQAYLAGISPYALAFDTSGNMYIADNNNQRIRKVDASSTITTVAGNGTVGYSGNNGPATAAELNGPSGIACDAAGNVYFTDSFNDMVRKIKVSSDSIFDVSGNGNPGYLGDGGPAIAAELFYPSSIAIDKMQNIYIGDQGNGVIRMINAHDTIRTVAGNGAVGSSGDGGPALAAEFHTPSGIAVDTANNLYIADFSNNKVRKVSMPWLTAINELATENESVSVYPNPSNGKFAIQWSGVSDQRSVVEVYNMLGEMVYNGQFIMDNGKYTIDLTERASGIYLIKMTGADGAVLTKKVSVMH